MRPSPPARPSPLAQDLERRARGEKPILQLNTKFNQATQLFLKDSSDEIPIQFSNPRPWPSPCRFTRPVDKPTKCSVRISPSFGRTLRTEDRFYENLRGFCDSPQPAVEALQNLARIEYIRGSTREALSRLGQAA